MNGDDRVPDPGLHRRDHPPGVALVPGPVEVLGGEPELDDEVAGQVLRADLAALLLPKADQGFLILPMIIRASEPPMKRRRSPARGVCSAILPQVLEINLAINFNMLVESRGDRRQRIGTRT